MMPYSSNQSADDPTLTEIRVCLYAAGGCSLVGGAALAYGWMQGERASLSALLPVAGLYLAMAVERAFKRWRTMRTKPGDGGHTSQQPRPATDQQAVASAVHSDERS